MTGDQLDTLRESLSDAHQDDSSYSLPETPSDFDRLTTTQILRLYRKIARANLHPHSSRIEMELTARLAIALAEHKESSDRAATRLERLTWALVGLTVVIAVLTVALVLGDG
jgi:hypothetical protein